MEEKGKEKDEPKENEPKENEPKENEEASPIIEDPKLRKILLAMEKQAKEDLDDK